MAGKKVYRYPHPILPAEYSEEANRYPEGEEGVWYTKAESDDIEAMRLSLEIREEIGSL